MNYHKMITAEAASDLLSRFTNPDIKLYQIGVSDNNHDVVTFHRDCCVAAKQNDLEHKLGGQTLSFVSKREYRLETSGKREIVENVGEVVSLSACTVYNLIRFALETITNANKLTGTVREEAN